VGVDTLGKAWTCVQLSRRPRHSELGARARAVVLPWPAMLKFPSLALRLVLSGSLVLGACKQTRKPSTRLAFFSLLRSDRALY
jgi:hypothetical protein